MKALSQDENMKTLRASRGRRSESQRKTRKATPRSKVTSALKKDLKEPTLLEMSA
jgi:hypothetical protein